MPTRVQERQKHDGRFDTFWPELDVDPGLRIADSGEGVQECRCSVGERLVGIQKKAVKPAQCNEPGRVDQGIRYAGWP